MRPQRKLLLLLCGTFAGLLFMGFSVPEGEEKDIRIERVYDMDCSCSYEYTYEALSGRLIAMHRLYRDTATWHGIGYFFEDNGDTGSVFYYDMGKETPLSISGKQGNRVSRLAEYVGGTAIDGWRDDYSRITATLRDDSARIDYAFADGERIFNEVYCYGRRVQRSIYNQQRFDSLKTAYYAVTGAQIFRQNCTSCHAIGKDATGPGLRGVGRRYTADWLRKWIANSGKMIAEGDPQAVQLYNKWHTTMTCFPYEKVYMDKLVDYLKTL